MTMREKLIEVAERTNFVECGTYEVNNWPEVIDAILTTLREPDEALTKVGNDAGWDYADPDNNIYEYGWPDEMICVAFTAMIDHIRSGK